MGIFNGLLNMSIFNRLHKKNTVIEKANTEKIQIKSVPWELPEAFLQFIINKFLEEAESDLPQLHRIKPLIIRFEIPKADKIGMLKIESNGDDANERSLWTAVVKKDSDVCCNNLITRGSTDEIKAYLKDESNFREIYDSIHELSDAVDEV